MNGNQWQTGGMDVVTFFYLFSWPLVLFTRGCLPLGQQYPPLNRKPDLGFRFLISPEPVFKSPWTCGRRWSRTHAGSGDEIVSYVALRGAPL